MKKDFTQLPPHIQVRFQEMGLNPLEKHNVGVKWLIKKVFTIWSPQSFSDPINTKEQRYSIVEDNSTLSALKNLFVTQDEEKPGKIVVTRRSLSLQEIDLFLADHPKYAKYKDDKENRYIFAEVEDDSGKYIAIVRSAHEFESQQLWYSLIGVNVYADGTEKHRDNRYYD